MTLEEYLDHYLVVNKMLVMFALALILALLAIIIVSIVSKIRAPGDDTFEKSSNAVDIAHNSIQRFYEMIFSATSILSFLGTYYLIDRFMVVEPYRTFWDKHSDMLLLLMICLSCVVNNYLDYLLIPLKKITKEEKASVRILGMLYIIMIFMYIKFGDENNNYDRFIMYFIGLMVGRFVYFDASFRDTIKTLWEAIKNMPLMIMGLAYTGAMCYYGFTSGYLLRSNGVLVSTFFAHLFMVVAIFVVHHTHIISLFVRKSKLKSERNDRKRQNIPNEIKAKKYAEEYDEYDEEYDDEYDEEYADEYDEAYDDEYDEEYYEE